MKYIRVVSPKVGKRGSYGILKGDKIHLLSCSPFSMNAEETGTILSADEVEKFLPPADPPNIIALGLNYADHAKESNTELPPAPVIFLKATSALTGHRQPIVLPEEAPSEVDYEAELTVVIGKIARNVPEKKVFDYISGYTCGNDVSARDCQLRIDKQWARGKSFDSFAPIGPVIETDLDPSNLKIQSRLNGKIMQDGNTSDLIFNVPRLISYLSRQMTLLPQTLIMTGTPAGVGFARKPPVFLKPGDKIEVEIEGIGILENQVIKETRR